MTHWCLKTILQVLLCFYFPRILHIIPPTQRGCLRHLISLSFSTNNKLPCGTFFHSCFVLLWNRILPHFFSFPLFLFPHKPDPLWPYLPHLLHTPLFFFLSPYLSATTFYLGYCFSCFLFPHNYVFHNQNIYFLRFLYAIFKMMQFQDTLTGFYSSGKTSSLCVFKSSSYLSYFPLIVLNSNFKLYSWLDHISGSWIVSLMLHVFHLFVTSFRPYCFHLIPHIFY